jgi:ribonuclease BN (tRNA processing enzyme)
VRIEFLGSGDGLGSGGRFQTCLHLTSDDTSLLIDCGASSLVAMKKARLDPSRVGAVAVSHLHGDHFGGIPFLILDGQFHHRSQPLLLAGPPGLEGRLQTTMEALFPGSSQVARRFPVIVRELAARVPTSVGAATVTAFPVDHASGAPAYALRVSVGGKTVAYSGDTQWTDTLIEAAAGVDLFICEAYFVDKKVRYHLDYQTLHHNWRVSNVNGSCSPT